MINKIKQFYVSLTNLLVSWCPPDNPKDNFEHVLLIRLDEMGDFILWLDSAKEIKNIYKDKKITLLVNEKWLPIAKTIPYWDDIIAINPIKFRFNPIYRIKFLLQIRKAGFHITVCPRYTIQFLLEPAIVAVSGSEEKIVFDNENFPQKKRNYWTKRIKTDDTEKMELIRNADFVRGLGSPDFKSSIPSIHVNKKMVSNNIIICPCSYRFEKDWPIYNYVELISRIHKKSDWNIIICNDIHIKDVFQDYVINISGGSNVMDFANLVAHSRLVIANDSGPIHLAAALDVPSVCIGVGKWGKRFVPYAYEEKRDGSVDPIVIYNQKVSNITVDEVWDKMKGLI